MTSKERRKEDAVYECRRLNQFERLLELVKSDSLFIRVGSVFGAGVATVVTALFSQERRTVLFICSDTEHQQDLYDDFHAFKAEPLIFPQLLEDVEKRVNSALERDRLRVLEKLASNAPTIVVSTARSVLQTVPSPEDLRTKMLKLQTTKNFSQEELLKILYENGYEKVDFVETPGEYSHRGCIVDVYSFNSSAPFRIEFFGNEIESIRIFDERTQQTQHLVEAIEIMLRGKETKQEEGRIFDFLPKGSIIVFEGTLPECEEWRPIEEEIQKGSFKTISFTATPVHQDEHSANFPFVPERVVGADTDSVMAYVEDCIKSAKKVFIFFLTEGDKERFIELSGGRFKNSQDVVFLNGSISSGFIAEGAFAVLSYTQLFGKSRLPRELEIKESAMIPEIEMEPGDFCVHTDYGICRFRGIETVKDKERTEQMLVFEFEGGAKLYLPPLEIDKVHRYIGAGRARPALSRLGDTTWLRRKERVKKALDKLSQELLLIQAKRMLNKGIAYPPDSQLQKEFEAAFPYTETEDQLKTVKAVKKAMEQPRPMDYLVAGDVGYGKTEVAMRSAFKAVEFGRQVAVLVPTTLLAEQHYRTFKQRMADYPIIIEVLSRFRKPSEQHEIIRRLKEGKTDIIIGTHRLLSKDVEFYDLGLVIIDEEQRFGVAQKEHFKRLRTSIDVLSLTATPIPRTLNMALSGIKDMSVLATPPPQKLAVITKVAPYSKNLIREAVIRELMRNGQVFFVHNRVKTIEQVRSELTTLIPEARFAVAHGQMDEYRLAETMALFLDRKIDVLVTTTIIENGLDIPTVNTLIVNNAHTFGLADLHQLRGRVGRHKEQAFAYFLVPSFERLNYTARQRLRAIEEFSRLGAGFQIALRDLEIRGAGNLLGREQAGLIHAVGYDLYVRLLSQTIAALKKQPARERLPVEVALPLEAHIPAEYISDMRQRIEFYRQIATADDLTALDKVQERMRDLFGKPPDSVKNLFLKARLSLALENLTIDYIGLRKEGILMRYRERTKIKRIVEKDPKNFWLVGEDSLYLRIPQPIQPNPTDTIMFILDKIERNSKQEPHRIIPE
jgi:transcription-repair coupling factor (superfamily II helicase)